MKTGQVVKLKDHLLEELNYLVKINRLHTVPQSLESIIRYLYLNNSDKEFNNLFLITFTYNDEIQLFPLDRDIPIIDTYKNYFEIINYSIFINVEEARAFYKISDINYYKEKVISKKEVKPKSNKIKLLEVNQFLNVNQNN